jgi:hypothetical protein
MGLTALSVHLHDYPQVLLNWQLVIALTYARIKRRLQNNGYQRDQYSIWIRAMTTAVETWHAMFDLLLIQPPGKFETTVKGLRMQHYQNLALFSVTDDIRLGGAAVHTLRGPVPANLVPAFPLHPIFPVPVVPGPGFQVPVNTKRTLAAMDVNNWLE